MIAVIDYKAGNLTSVQNALNYLGYKNQITADAEIIRNAERVIFPGVGAAKSSMEQLKISGLNDLIKEAVSLGKPVLGICVGCQIILNHSEEDGGVDCLGLLPGNAVQFKRESGIKIPHMGWNQVEYSAEHPLFAGIASGTEFYFVHSYHPVMNDPALVLANTTYGTQRFASVIGRENLVASQFHMEKSGVPGLQMLKNFCNWSGKEC
jgi:glutamine amidotransferase